MSRPEVSDVFRAIADPTRRGILDGLVAGEATAGEIAGRFALTFPAVSQHLKVLREVGLVSERRDGRNRRYRLRPEPLREVGDWIARYERFWSDKLDALGRYLEEEG